MEDDWNVDCSDSELADIKGPWEPCPEEIDRLYTILDKDKLPELHWKCPGYRSPSPECTSEPEEVEQTQQTEDKSDFDFMDETTSSNLKIRKQGEGTLKGSAKKKTTSFNSVLSNMRRHKLLPSKNKEN